MGFNLVNLAITIHSDNCPKLTSLLPLSGSAFSSACRHLCCNTPERVCRNCPDRTNCSWSGLFGQELTCDPDALKRHQKPPLPFVFTFPVSESDNDVQEGTLLCDLVVIGSAIPHSKILLHGLIEMLAGESFPPGSKVISVSCRDYLGQVQQNHRTPDTVADDTSLLPNELVVASMEGLLESRIWNASEVCLELTSPLRLIENGRMMSRFDFGRFARSIMRRISSLSYYYGESELEWDFKELSCLIDSVICTEDAFRFKKQPQSQLSGIVGNGCFIGDLILILPLLHIGSFVHAGKGATFGMGVYNIISKH